MEIPPSSSVAQISAYFTGFSEDEKQKQFLDIHPFTVPFKPTNSLDIIPAASSSGLPSEYKTEDFKYAWQMYLGQLMYPFDNVAQVTHHQFDPLYFDGSEERAAAFNVQENLISLPLDSPQLVDPRVSYIDSLMKMREYTAGNIPLDSSYLNTLFMSTTEKGANYYLNQLKDLDEALGKSARQGYAIKNSVEIPEDIFRRHAARGVPTHSQLDSSIQSRFMENFSSTATTQSNYRRDQMKQAEFINEPSRIPVTPQEFNTRMERRKRKKEVIKQREQEAREQREQRSATQPPNYILDYGDASYGGGGVTEESRNDDEVNREAELHVYDDDRNKIYTKADDEFEHDSSKKKGRKSIFKRIGEEGDKIIKDVGKAARGNFNALGEAAKSQEAQEFLDGVQETGWGIAGGIAKGTQEDSEKVIQVAGKESGKFLRTIDKRIGKTSDLLSLGVMGGAAYAWNQVLGNGGNKGGKNVRNR